MPLIQKMSLTLLTIALLPVFLVASIFYFNASSSLQSRELNQLNAIAAIQKSRVQNLIAQNQRLLNSYTSRPALVSIIDQYNHQQGKAAAANQALLQTSVTTLQTGYASLKAASILNPAGVVLASTQTSSVGSMYERTPYVDSGRVKNDVTSYIVRDTGGALDLYLVGPFKQNGQLVGVAVLESDMRDFLGLTTDYTGLDSTGETMLVKRAPNGDALDLLPLRFDKQAALSLTVGRLHTLNPAIQALWHQETTFTNATDYRGHTVLAATRYVPEADWGLVVMVDRDEAYAPLAQLGNVLLIVMFILSVVIIFVAFFLARLLNEPILGVAVAADRLRNGDLAARAPVNNSDEIGQLAGTFNAMAENVEKIDQMKSEFVLLTSHQLRTPATAVKGFISMLLDGYAGKVAPKQRELIEAAYKENERQISVINSILDVARLEAGEMVLVRSMNDVRGVITASADGQASLLASAGQKIKLELPKKPVKLWIDADKLQLVIDNLIHNAIKYSPRGTTITVGVRTGRVNTQLVVQDEGMGIAKRDLNKLFKRFSRIAGPRTTNIQGAGLGLYLAQKLVAMHGGTIDVQSREGTGTSFTITLPNLKEGGKR